MGKSGRHKKLNRQEKAKTNLKGVKKLAKAQNVVEPSLKVKRIVIREQLASTFGGGDLFSSPGSLSNAGVPTTSRKQTLGDILSSLRHHNTSIRREALGGLTELVTSSPGVLKNSLDKVLERILFLLQDLESSVRVENLKCAQALFERLSEDHLNAYWGLVLSHIRAAITHLNSKVRTHSLSFIRLLTIHFPEQVKTSASAILPPVLSLLVGGGAEGGGGPEVLKATGVRERLAVFSLVASILSLEQEEQLDEEEDKSSSNNIVVFSGQEKRKCPSGLVYPVGYYGSGGNKSLWEDGRKEDETWWGPFVMQAFKLVTATWVEVKDGEGGRKRRVQEDETEDCEMIDLDEQPGIMLKKKPVKMTIVNATEVEVLDSLVGVLFSIIGRLKTMAAGKRGFASDCVESLRKNEGPDVKKYFIALLPFEASNPQISSKLVMKLNLRLFSIASQLRLIDSKVRGILANYLVNIADMGLESDHINLSLRILQDFKMGSVDKRDVYTSFLCSILDVESNEEWRKLCMKLDEFLRLNRTNNEEEQEKKNSFIHSVDWNKVVEVLGKREKVTKELLRVFTHLKLRNLGITSLSGVVEVLMEKGCFKRFMEKNSTNDEDRKALQRFLWYMELKDKLEEHHLASVMCGVEL